MGEAVKIYKRPRLRKPYMLVAWPGMGEVAFRTAIYLIEKLKAVEFASLNSEGFFYLTGGTIKDGILDLPELPEGRFYYHRNKSGKNDLIIFLSNAQPDLSKADEYAKKIISVAKLFKVELIIGIAAMPATVDHTQQPHVWFTATTRELSNTLLRYGIQVLNEGQISGMNGLFLAIAKREGFRGFCLLGEIPLYTIQIENPKAVMAVLDILAKIMGIEIDLSELLEQARIMEEEINKLLDYLKLDTQGQGPIGEEEIEKIKKTLSQLTKLPASVKEKIEKLFQEAKNDIAKAMELKVELDRWNVYKEYEDRFLDLFRKKKEKDN